MLELEYEEYEGMILIGFFFGGSFVVFFSFFFHFMSF